MTIEKPWQKPVIALLETMKTHWGGTVLHLVELADLIAAT